MVNRRRRMNKKSKGNDRIMIQSIKTIKGYKLIEHRYIQNEDNR